MPSQRLLDRRMSAPSAAYQQWLSKYQDWQWDAKRFARTVGVARFTANLVASTAGRVDLLIEEYDAAEDEWKPTEDPQIKGLMREYRNETLGQTAPELVRLHTWHYEVAGEAALITRDDSTGSAEFLVSSLDAIEWDKPGKDNATVRLAPQGILMEGTAFVVPRDQVIRYWMPDEEWLGLATSPMTAAMDDLRRYRSLVRYAQRQAENYLAMNGILWTPQSAHPDVTNPDPSEEDNPADHVAANDVIFDLYNTFAQTSINTDDRLESVVAPMMWYGAAGDEPKWIDMGGGLDEHGPDHRKEALEDWARGTDSPASLIVGGGSSDENHWGAWVTQERFVAAVAPTLNRVTHQDLTVAYLWPRLRLLGNYQVRNYRVGYDPTPVIVHPDMSDKALRGWLAGIIGSAAARQYMGFEESDAPTQADQELLAKVLSNFGGAAGSTPAVKAPGEKVGPGTVQEIGPKQPQPSGTGSPLGLAAGVLDPYLPGVRTSSSSAPLTINELHIHNGNGHDEQKAITAASLNSGMNDGIMVALPVPPQVAAEQAQPDGEAPADYHMTLMYVGKIGDTPETAKAALEGICAALAADSDPPRVDLSHIERFTPTPGGHSPNLEPCALVDDGPDVPALFARLMTMCNAAKVPYHDDHAFRSHVTVGYWPTGEGPAQGKLPSPYSYSPDALMLHWGDEVSTYPFVLAPAAGAHPHDTGVRTAAWDESLHPRDERGRFGQGTGEPAGPDKYLTATDTPIGVFATYTPASGQPDLEQVALDWHAKSSEGPWRHVTLANEGVPLTTPPHPMEIERRGEDTAGDLKMSIAHDLAERMTEKGVTTDDFEKFAERGGERMLTIRDDGRLTLSFPGPNATGSSTIAVDRSDPAYPALLAEAVTSQLVGQWAATANDQDAVSLAIQDAAARVFGLTETDGSLQATVAEWNDYGSNADEITATSGPMLEAFVQSQYDATQEMLAANGIDHVDLYRGVDLSGEAQESSLANEIIRTGMTGSGTMNDTQVDLRPLSSFSLDASTAGNFQGSEEMNAVLNAAVPAERIVGTFATGVGSYQEHEFVVIGGGDTRFDVEYNWSDYEREASDQAAEIKAALGDKAGMYPLDWEMNYDGDTPAPYFWLTNPLTGEQIDIDPYDAVEIQNLADSLHPDPVNAASAQIDNVNNLLPAGWLAELDPFESGYTTNITQTSDQESYDAHHAAPATIFDSANGYTVNAEGVAQTVAEMEAQQVADALSAHLVTENIQYAITHGGGGPQYRVDPGELLGVPAGTAGTLITRNMPDLTAPSPTGYVPTRTESYVSVIAKVPPGTSVDQPALPGTGGTIEVNLFDENGDHPKVIASIDQNDIFAGGSDALEGFIHGARAALDAATATTSTPALVPA